MLSRPVACSGRLKARQPFLVCYYYAIKTVLAATQSQNFRLDFRTEMRQKWRDLSELNTSCGQPVSYLTSQPDIQILQSLAGPSVRQTVSQSCNFFQLLNQSFTQRLSQVANQIARNLTVQSGNESVGHIGLYNHCLASQSDRQSVGLRVNHPIIQSFTCS